jgi:RAT1-interacting protein
MNDTLKNTELPPPQNSSPATDAPVHRFSIQPVNRFRGASATIKRPREVANFSYDDNHKYQADESGINYYIPPPMGADLKEGFETFRHYEDKEDPHLDSLLQALMEDSQGKGEVKADFMTWRGMMTKVC